MLFAFTKKYKLRTTKSSKAHTNIYLIITIRT